MRLKYSVFLAFTLIVACSQQENNNKITYEPDKKTLEIDISKSITSNETFLEKIKITKILFLNGEDENFVTSARKIIEKNSLLYILDYKSKKLSIFNNEGNYVGQIGSKGRGPGEYTSIVDFVILDNGNIVTVGQQGLMLYDKNGDHLFTKGNIYPTHICKLGANKFAGFMGCNERDSSNLFVFDSELEKIDEFFPFPHDNLTKSGFFDVGGIQSNSSGLLYNDISSPVFHEVTSDKNLFAKYKITGSNKLWSFEERYELAYFQASMMQLKNIYHPFSTFQENEKSFIFSMLYEKKIRTFFYDKDTQKVYLPDVLGKKHMYPLFLTYDGLALSENNEFITTVYMDKFYRSYKEEMKADLEKSFPELLTLTEGTDEYSNPALVYFTFGE